MPIAQQFLADRGITIDDAHAWLAANIANPQHVLDVCSLAGITNAILGEIAGWPQTPYPAIDVIQYFSGHGLDSHPLDASPGVLSITNASAHEGATLDHTVVLAGQTQAQTLLAVGVLFREASLQDFSSVTFSQGVTMVDQGGLHLAVPAGVSSFDIFLGAAADGITENSESYVINVGGVPALGYITDF